MPIHVHDFELDPVRFELRRAGEPVRVEPRVLEVLFYLAAHPDRVVSKQELLEQVWESRFVSESTLTRCIAEARRALGGGDPRQSPIQTVHGRGFRFVLPEGEMTCSENDRATRPSPWEGEGWDRGEARRGAFRIGHIPSADDGPCFSPWPCSCSSV